MAHKQCSTLQGPPKKRRKVVTNEDNSEVIETACLGRPFQLGMLYDCRSDMLITGPALWRQGTIEKSLHSEDLDGSDSVVITEDSLDSKASTLNISGSLKLSFLSNLVEVSGSAGYLQDRKSSKHQSRVSLKYWSTSKYKRLTMDHLATEKIEYPEVFSDGMATHVVTGIVYGADAILVFDRTVEEGENIRKVHGKVRGLIDVLSGLKDIGLEGEANFDMNDEEKQEATKLKCSFHGDIRLRQNPTNFSDAVSVYRQLPDLISGIGVPKRAHLYPLSKLNNSASKLVHEINVSFVHRAQAVMEELLDLKMQADDLKKTSTCFHFSAIQTQLNNFTDMLSEYKSSFSSNLKAILPTVRAGAPETTLAKLFRSKEASPFNNSHLTEWLKLKEHEVKVLETYLSMMKDIEFAFTPGDLDKVLIEHDIVVCFCFKVVSIASDYLDKLKAYNLNPESSESCTSFSEHTASQPWFQDRLKMVLIRQRAKKFITFAAANKDNDKVKFVVVNSSSDEGTDYGCDIVLYDNLIEKNKFELPSAPNNVQALQGGVTHNSIQLQWSNPELGSDNIESYTVCYRQEDDPSDAWVIKKSKGNGTCLTVDGLEENKRYLFKVRAESRAGVTHYSKVSDCIVTASRKDHTLSWKNIRSEIYEDGFTWDILARHLGMTQKKIDIIWSSSLETEVNLKQTIKWWLHQRDASWSGLAEALQEMDHKKLADQIRRNHPQ